MAADATAPDQALQSVDPALRELIAPDAVERLSTAEVQAATEHVLEKFTTLLNPNPRSIKRFVNADSVQWAARTLEGNAISTDPLALWTILQIRWPGLVDYLRAEPEAIKFVAPSGEHPDDLPEYLQKVFRSSELRRIVEFDEGEPLTSELILACCGGAAVEDEGRPDDP